jgi:hypothetical protein
VCTFNANKNKAWRILEGDDDVFATSPKVSAFADTILYGCTANCIVVDVWHARACITKPKEGRVDCQSAPTYRQYKRLEEITLEEAKAVEQAPCHYQATIWITVIVEHTDEDGYQTNDTVKISCRELKDGNWSIVGWSKNLSIRTTSTKHQALLEDFASALLYVNDVHSVDANNTDKIIKAIEEVIK